MEKILLTGFAPFAGESINPSWEAVKKLTGKQVSGHLIQTCQLPCVFGKALTVLKAQLAEHAPSLCIAVGLASGSVDIRVERIAININDASIPDNDGNQPVEEPILTNGPAAYFSTLPCKKIVSTLHEQGIPASVSNTAGTYVCNHVMYGLLHEFAQGTKHLGGFIHVPWLPEQAVHHAKGASMTVDMVVKALEIAINISLNTLKENKATEYQAR